MTNSFRFGTVGTPTATPARPGGTLGALQFLPTLGLHALELAWVHSVSTTPPTCALIAAAAQAADVALSVHAPYFINLNATPEEWLKARERLLKAARVGAAAGATDIIFHPGSYFGQPPEQALAVAVPRLQECAATLQSEQVAVTLRPETMGKGALLGSLEDTLVLAREVPGVLPCMDIAHLHARAGDGSVNSYAEFAAILTKIGNGLGEESLHRLHIHISGIVYTAKGERHHIMLAESDLAYREFLQALRDFGCGGRMVCESPVMEDDAQHLKAIWESL